MTSKSKKSKLKMKEFVCKWKESQKEVVVKQEDKLAEVVVLYSERDDHENWITCEVCPEEFENQEELDQHQEELYEVFENACAREREKEDYIQCKDCEYSTDNFYDLGRHTYKNHSAGGRKYKEIVVDVTSVSVQTDDTNLMKSKECEHSENLKDSWRNFHIETDMDKEKVVDKKKEVDVQTEPVFIKSKDCESSTDDLNEYFRVAVSGLTVKQEFKCRDCSENFRIKRHLMTHSRATHKEKVKICRKFAARIHCPFGSERCWYIHKESGTNQIIVFQKQNLNVNYVKKFFKLSLT